MPNCTSAFRFMEHFYCFHGHMFSKFDPKTGEVNGKYPKEARDFFMRCSKFSKSLPDSEMDVLLAGVHLNPGELPIPSDPAFTMVNCSVLLTGNDSDPVERERCSRVHLDAIASDNAGNMYAFRGEMWKQPLLR